MSDYEIEVEGIKATVAKFRQLAMMADSEAVSNAVLSVGEEMRDEMRAKVVIRTGNLWRAIVAKRFKKPTKSGKKSNLAFVAINRNKKGQHAHLIEKGHIARDGITFVPPHPFFRPVKDKYRSGVYNEKMKRHFERIINETMRTQQGGGIII